ncbi:MAG: translation initiation factor IF-2 [Eubacteriales bacterium]|nr:translation initiation factor IF-2 [Eubacteriales bacterium]MDY3332258.1 translation initiation factor IF-2 [Gallibacter sp.]
MKIKVSDLAKKLGIKSKEVLDKASELGVVAKAANSSITEEEAIKIEKSLSLGAGTATEVEELSKKKNTNIEKELPMGKAMKKNALPGGMKLTAVPMKKADMQKQQEKIELDKSEVVEVAETKKEVASAVVELKTEKDAISDGVKSTVKEEKIDKKVAVEEKKAHGVKIVKKAEDVAKEKKIENDSIKTIKESKTKDTSKVKKEAEKEVATKKVVDAEKKIKQEEKAEEEKPKVRIKVIKTADQIKQEEKERKIKQNKTKKDKSHKERNKDFKGRDNDRDNVKENNFADVAMPQKEDRKSKKSKKKDKEKLKDREDQGKRRKKQSHYDEFHYGEQSLEKKAKKKYKKAKDIEPEVEEIQEVPTGTKVINIPITIAGFCEQVGISVSSAIMALMKLGIVTNLNATLDEDTALILSEEMGISIVIGKVEEEVVEEGLEVFEDKEEDLVGRPPIITVMGHVDHGKTSLLDAIRTTNVTAQESGGITQHIGASEVRLNGKRIVFLDTPGHEAFTAMRARGANITDIAILVVAADDSVKPQTIESISHAKAAGVPIIVAINKMDKPGANPDIVKKDLAENNVLVEDWGGDVISVPVSAKTGEGIENLLEMVLLQAEVLELKANPKRLGLGTVIEARLDKSKGPVATLLVANGTVKSGQSIVAGNTSGRIRLMTDFKGKTIKKATPATAVEILGLTEVPAAGDDFNIVQDDKTAREIASSRQQKQREEILARNASSSLEELFNQIKEGEVKDLNLIIKGDVMGSVGAIIASLEKLSNENVRVNIIHSGVGAITESDVTLASTSGAVIIGFNVRPSSSVQSIADRENVQLRTYRVIYNIIDDVENAMKGMLDPEFVEVVLGQMEIRDTFKVPSVGTIGGAYVTDGKIERNSSVRIVRDGIVVHEGKLSSLKRFKDDVREVAQGYECGVGIENYNDIKEGDIVECFKMQEVARD